MAWIEHRKQGDEGGCRYAQVFTVSEGVVVLGNLREVQRSGCVGHDTEHIVDQRAHDILAALSNDKGVYQGAK